MFISNMTYIKDLKKLTMNREQVWKFLDVDVDESDSSENSFDSLSVKLLFSAEQLNLW